jgi:transposase-like protein
MSGLPKEETIRKIQQVEKMIASGETVVDACDAFGIKLGTFFKGRAKLRKLAEAARQESTR